MKKLLLILSITILAGCGTPQRFTKFGVTPQQANQDTLECRMEAMKVEASTQNAIIGVLNARDTMHLCLQIRGYM